MTEVKMTTADELRAKAAALKAEADQLEKDADEAKRQARMAAEEVKREDAHKQKIAERHSFTQSIASAVLAFSQDKDRKIKECYADFISATGFARLMIDGRPYTDIDFNMEQKNTGMKWRSESTGRLRITVGNYGNRQSFPMRKDGTFNWMSIASVIYWEYINTIISLEKRKAADINSKVASVLSKELGLEEKWQPVLTGSDDPKQPIEIAIKINRNMSVSKARRIAQLYNQMMNIISEKEEG